MITIHCIDDFTLENYNQVVYHFEQVRLTDGCRQRIEQGRISFLALIAAGEKCYGVNTGLGNLVNKRLDEQQRASIPSHILIARAAASGEPMAKSVSRGTLFAKLANFVSGCDGVSLQLVDYLLARLNADFCPVIPRDGHGMAADAVAHSHCFQTFIGLGKVFSGNSVVAAKDELAKHNIPYYQPKDKEGLALISGLAASNALGFDVLVALQRCWRLLNQTAALSVIGAAANYASYDTTALQHEKHQGIDLAWRQLSSLLQDNDYTPFKYQSPISYRCIPQVHGAYYAQIRHLQNTLQHALARFSDNPFVASAVSADNLEDTEPCLLPVGSFHDQSLVLSVESSALALAHVAALSVHRMHRLLDPSFTGLQAQLAITPGVDAGMVVVHKAAVALLSRVKQAAMPLSLWGNETSLGQEDYQSLAIPVMQQLEQQLKDVETLLCHEALMATVACQLRGTTPCGELADFFASLRSLCGKYDQEISPGEKVQAINDWWQAQALEFMRF